MIVLQHQCYKGAPRRTKGAIGIWRQRNVSCGVSQCYHQGKTNTDSSTNNLQLWGRVMKVLILRARQFRATLWYTWMTLPPSVNKVARVCLQEGEGQLSHPLMNTPSPEFCFVFTKRWPIMPVCGLSSKLYFTVIISYFFVFVLEMTCPRTGVTLRWSSTHRALNGTHFAPWSNKCPNVLAGIVAPHKSDRFKLKTNKIGVRILLTQGNRIQHKIWHLVLT